MIYDFRTMNEKDLFKAKLVEEEIDFGFIPKWNRKKFVQFCKDNELIIPHPKGWAEYTYKVNNTFRYQITRSEHSFSELFEWFIDLTNYRKNAQTRIQTVKISPNTQPNSRLKPNVNFNWVVCTKDIIF